MLTFPAILLPWRFWRLVAAININNNIFHEMVKYLSSKCFQNVSVSINMLDMRFTSRTLNFIDLLLLEWLINNQDVSSNTELTQLIKQGRHGAPPLTWHASNIMRRYRVNRINHVCSLLFILLTSSLIYLIICNFKLGASCHREQADTNTGTGSCK